MISLTKQDLINFIRNLPEGRVNILENSDHTDSIYIVAGIETFRDLKSIKAREELGDHRKGGETSEP